MTEEKDGRIREAFDSVRRDLDARLGDEERAAVDRLHAAAAEGDAAHAREELASVKDRHGWLYEELVKHPRLATIVDELALWGF